MKWKKDKTTEKKQKEGMNSTPDYREWNLDDDPEEETPGKKRKLFGKKKSKKKTDQIVRIEELEDMLEKYGDDVDPETIVSMYVPHRKQKRIGEALLRMDKLHLVLMGMMLVAHFCS